MYRATSKLVVPSLMDPFLTDDTYKHILRSLSMINVREVIKAALDYTGLSILPCAKTDFVNNLCKPGWRQSDISSYFRKIIVKISIFRISGFPRSFHSC